VNQHVLSADVVRFRNCVIDALWDDNAFGYIDKDAVSGHCPICGEVAFARFAAATPRVTMFCYGGCTETEVATRIGLRVRP
jgi:hypothetical protein